MCLAPTSDGYNTADDGREQVDFDAVRKNASEQGVELRFITIKYENLTDDETNELTNLGLLTRALSPGTALGRFMDDGRVLFPEKATAVFTLGG
jgi:hypothetical protein